jgi:serine/threonine-protein kinase
MAPERVRRKQSDHRSDIYSAGVMFFKMLAGTLPLSEQEPIRLLSRKSANPDSIFTMRPSETTAAIDIKLENIILKSIAADPDNRYRTCREFADDLEKYQSVQ